MSLRGALRTSLAVLFLGGFINLFPAIAPITNAEDPSNSGIAEDARSALARMSKTLQAKQFSYNSHTLRAYSGPNGELLHIARSRPFGAIADDRRLVIGEHARKRRHIAHVAPRRPHEIADACRPLVML